jgi:hypothetical protein
MIFINLIDVFFFFLSRLLLLISFFFYIFLKYCYLFYLSIYSNFLNNSFWYFFYDIQYLISSFFSIYFYFLPLAKFFIYLVFIWLVGNCIYFPIPILLSIYLLLVYLSASSYTFSDDYFSLFITKYSVISK